MSSEERTGYSFEEIQTIASAIQSRVKCRPLVGVICGSGLGGLADSVLDPETVPYADLRIHDFPVSTVEGHAGQFVFGTLRGKPVMLMQGRFHYYEGYPMWKVAMPVRVMKAMGVNTLFITNAAGGINPDYNVGDFMLIRDHIDLPGLAGQNVLRGANDDRFGPRFLPMINTYDQEIRNIAKSVAKDLNLSSIVREGIYMMQGGPTFETIAEYRFLRIVGADAVGMSTAPEAILARHCDMRVFGVSLITDMASLDYSEAKAESHDAVLEVGRRSAKTMEKFISAIIEKLSD